MATLIRTMHVGDGWDYEVMLVDGRTRVLHSSVEQSDPAAWASAWEIENAIRELEEAAHATS